MKFWLHHPAIAEPVSFRRWLAFLIGDRLERLGRRLSQWAVWPDDDIPF